MRVFRYWARADVDADGSPADGGVVGAAGWSDVDVADARRHALDRARQFARWLREDPARLRDRYAYAPPAVREPLLAELHHAGRRVAAVTRNAYGADVLNAAELFIADLDAPPPAAGGRLRALWDRAIGRPRPPSPEDVARRRVGEVVAARPGLCVRLYRTAAGHRAIVTDRPIPAATDDARDLLAAHGADPLYTRLCDAQQCYRARLTPKPWRIGLPAPYAGTFPHRPEDEPILATWQAAYDAAAGSWAVCELVETFGGPAVAEELADVLALHDARTIAAARPLA